MNILGFNIGQNYKGILNLGSTINTPLSATLQSVTDGMGVASPLQLSTTQVSNVFTGSHTILWRANSILTDYSGWHQSDGTFVILKKDGNSLWFNIDSAVNFSSGFGSTGRSSINAAGNWTIGGAFTNTARVHVRGDGTNPIARFESTSGSYALLINSLGDTLYGSGNFINIRGSLAGGGGVAVSLGSFNSLNATSGTQWVAETIGTFTGNAGNGNKYLHNFAYTINNAGAQTGTLTGILLNATETALNGMTHNLMDLGTGGGTYVSRFRVGSLFTNPTNGILLNNGVNSGFISLSNVGTGNLTFGHSSYGVGLQMDSNGIVSMLGVRMVWGGTTNAFPALKRNGAALEVRLADDSGFAGLSVSTLTISGNWQANNNNTVFGTVFNYIINPLRIGGSTQEASAMLEVSSTTRGFLLPRMTEAQRLAIAGGTPAIGLMVYQTDGTDGLYVYKAGGWQFIA